MKLNTHLKETQVLAAATETKTKEIEQKKSDAKEQTTRLHDHCHKLKDHDDLTESLQNEKDSHLLRSTDLKHDLVWKCKDPQELKSHTLLTSANNSLSNELAQIGVFTCDQCSSNFICESALKKPQD